MRFGFLGKARSQKSRNSSCLCDDQMMTPVVSYLLVLAAALVCFGPGTNAQQGEYTAESVGIQLCPCAI